MSPASYLTAPPRVAAAIIAPCALRPLISARTRPGSLSPTWATGRSTPWSGARRSPRLGEGVDARRRLLPLPIARVRNVLSEYRRRIEELGAERVLCVATSAVRDAENGEAFLGEIEWSYGFTTRLLTGEEEARLTFAGATLGRDDLDGVMVVDIGGGSTELVLADRAVEHGRRLRPADRAVRRGPRGDGRGRRAGTLPDDLDPSARDRRRRDDHVAGRPRPRPRAVPRARGGRARPERGHSREPGRRARRRSRSRSASELGPLNPKRAPFILAGAVILDEILRRYALDGIEASVRDLLDGAALEAAKLPEPAEGEAPPGAYVCC